MALRCRFSCIRNYRAATSNRVFKRSIMSHIQAVHSKPTLAVTDDDAARLQVRLLKVYEVWLIYNNALGDIR